MHHYVYKITNIKNKKFYIGIRTSHNLPKNDLGINYFSSSKDKDFIKDQKLNNKNYKYEILKICKSRNEALKEEIRLHQELDVSNNSQSYNIVKQTNTKFDTTGYIFINGKKIKSSLYESNNTEKYHTSGKHTVVDANGNRFYVSTTDERYLNGELKSIQVGKVMAKDKKGNTLKISKEEFDKNDEYNGVNNNKFSYKDKNGNYFMVDTNDPRVLSGEFIHCTTNMVVARNIKTNEIVTISKEEFDKSEYFVGINKNKITGKNNPNAKNIKIYNKNNELMYNCNGDFKKTCIANKLPFAALVKSYKNYGKPIYIGKNIKKINLENLSYIGWYAIANN